MQAGLRTASRSEFRVLHFSIQHDHVHLIAEADTRRAWRSGIQGLVIRLARRLNRTLGRRGAVWASRYHARLLRTPREVRNAIVYVLQNWKKHLRHVVGLDPCSSARWFTGWRAVPGPSSGPSPPVATPRTWLASVGWRRLGLIGMVETPGGGMADVEVRAESVKGGERRMAGSRAHAVRPPVACRGCG